MANIADPDQTAPEGHSDWGLQHLLKHISSDSYSHCGNLIYFIPSCEFNAYLKQTKVILSAVKKCQIFSLVTNTIYIFTLYQTEAVSTIKGLISSRKDPECTVLV